jgi:hypothetical protein
LNVKKLGLTLKRTLLNLNHTSLTRKNM